MTLFVHPTIDGGKRFTVEFTARDLMTVPLDKIDMLQLFEKSEGIADYLLDAELIARRLEQSERSEAARGKEQGNG